MIGEEMTELITETLETNGLDVTKTELFWQFLKDESRLYHLLGDVAQKHDAILSIGREID